MDDTTRLATNESFLAGGGAMGELIRSMDWSKTPLGPISEWPQSLRTTVSLCISSNFPMSMAWGPEHIQIYNDGYWPICGGKHPESMGQNFTECWASAMPVIGDAFSKALAGESSYIQNQRMFLDRHGYLEETFFTFSFSPIRDESGGVGGLFHPVNETTSRMLTERRDRALRELTERTGTAESAEQALTESAKALADQELDLPFVLFYLVPEDQDEARLVASVGLEAGSPAAPAQLSLDDDATPGWPVSEVLRGHRTIDVPDLAERFPDLTCAPYPEPPTHAQILPIMPPGAAAPRGLIIAGSSSRLPFNAAYASFFRLLAAAVTAAVAKAEAYEQERKRAEALAEIDRAKTLFFSNVSHEFRTPLTLMLGPLEEAFSDDGLAPATRAKLEVVQRNGQRLLKLVNTLLDFSRIEAGRSQASYEPTDLAALTADLAASFRSACDQAGLTLEVRCDTLPEPVYVDRDMWEKIVLNLMSNAFKFTFDGGLSIATGADAEHALLTVADTGVGIPEAELPRIFDRFHRVSGARGRSFEGSGIGLALVQEIIKLHGGSIEVDSRVDHGTTFTVRIPFGSAHLPQEHIGADRSLASTATRADVFINEARRWLPGEPEGAAATPTVIDTPNAPAPAAHATERARILWADDNADMRDYVRRLLSPLYEVTCAADGSEALLAARQAPPDLVLSDVMMPRLDGFGLIREMRADPRLRLIPVILLSARAGEESRVEGLEAGASDYLVKPFPERELLARVEAQLALARLRRQVARGEALSDRILQSSQDGIQLLDLDGRIVSGNDIGLGALAGPACASPLGQAYTAFWRDEDRAAAERAVAQALAGGAGRFAAKRVDADGRVTWWDELVTPVLDDAGRPERLLVISRDVTDARAAAEKRDLLLHELNHRVKNTLAIVQSIAMQTMRGADAQDRQDFEQRLLALANSHDLLTRQHWESADLHTLVTSTLQPFAPAGGEGEAVEITGPKLQLQPKQVLALGLGLHELATNAAKYGALSGPGGRVQVSWAISDGRLDIRWRERGGPPVSPPEHNGFGTRLIRAGLSHQLGADVTMAFPPEGVECAISLKVPVTHV